VHLLRRKHTKRCNRSLGILVGCLILMAKVSMRLRTKIVNTSWIHSKKWSTKTDIMRPNIMIQLRIKEIIMDKAVANTIMITATSNIGRHLETINNTISLLDRTSQVSSLELSREEIDTLETMDLLRILALVVNLVTLNRMIWIIEIFITQIRMHQRTTITAVYHKNTQVILTYTGQFKPHSIM